MLGKLPVDNHRELFRTRLVDVINLEHEFALLANKGAYKGCKNIRFNIIHNV
ncbi:MAG: hypothetical protein LBP56_02025 [Odoribacteraceae bacterium]|jgi:hypothetical protein|nr:hypothetical protein [Odoribacteraceae bacterium]